MSLSDIAAMKLNAIADNGTRVKDFIDIYFILKSFSLLKILEYYQIKYKNRNVFHVVKSLSYFEDVIIDDRPVMIEEKYLKFSKKSETIINAVNNINS